MFAPPRYRICLVMVVVAASVVLVSPPHEPAAAQGERDDYVDVGLILEVPRTLSSGTSHDLDIIVTNAGSGTAYDVEVVVEVISPDKSFLKYLPSRMPTTGQVFFSLDRRTLRWVIPELGELQRVESTARVQTVEYIGLTSVKIFENQSYPHELFGRVTTPSFESDLHMGNNTSRVWSYSYRTVQDSFIQAGGNYTVEVSTDEFFPTSGSITNFTITTDRPRSHVVPGNATPPIDLKVDIELTDGLSVAGAPTYASGRLGTITVPASVRYSDGVFTVGTLKRGEPVRNSVTLPVRLARGATASGQCLTATLTGNPPPGIGPDDDVISDNVAKLCLGVQLAPLMSEQVDAFTIYPCVGNTDPPCDNTDDVRVRAVDKSATQPWVMGPGEAVVHVPDSPNREYDSHDNSVNAGTEVSWQIPVIWNAESFDAVRTEWTNLRDGFTISGANGGAPPGRVHIRAFEGTSYAITYKMQPDTTPPWTGVDAAGFTPGPANGPYEYIAEFEKLGTYQMGFTVKATRAMRDGDEDCDPNASNVNQRFCATETYTFHVGPISDLEVKAALAAGAMTAGNQVAFTVTATYHGPENRARGVRVPITLPAGMKFVRADSEDYNPQTGVWNIGELKVKGFRQSLRQPESETLTIVAELTGDVTEPVKAVEGSIKSHQDYCVRIKSGGTPGDDLPCDGTAVPTGYTEHSAPYYDHRPDNNQFSLNPNWEAVAAKNPPYLTGLSISSYPTPNVNGPGSYLIGNVIEVSARFSKVVYVTGSPTLRLQIGNEEREADYAGGSGTGTLRFRYTVGKWDRDDNGLSIPANPFVLRGNPIRDGDGNDAMLDFAGLGDQAGHVVGGPGTPATPPEPQAAGRLTATARDGAVDLEWPAGSDGDKVFWQLWRNDDPNWREIFPRVMGSKRGYTVTGLENGREYMFRVRAHYKYEHGDTPGPPSAPAFATPTGPAAPPPGQTPPPGQPAGPNTPPEFDRDTAWADYCVNGGTGSGVEVARVTAFDQDGDRLTFYQVKGFDAIGDNHFSVSTVRSGDADWGVIRTSRTIPRNLEPADGLINIDLEVNDGRGGVDQIGVSLQYDPDGGNCQEDTTTGSRSTEAGERGPSVLAAVRTWAGSVRNWWAEFANRTFTGPTFLSWRDAWFAAHPGAVPPSSR